MRRVKPDPHFFRLSPRFLVDNFNRPPPVIGPAPVQYSNAAENRHREDFARLRRERRQADRSSDRLRARGTPPT
jgi:hypothetical protein